MKPSYKIIVQRSVNFHGIESTTYTAQQIIGDSTLEEAFSTKSEAEAWLGRKHVAWLRRELISVNTLTPDNEDAQEILRAAAQADKTSLPFVAP